MLFVFGICRFESVKVDHLFQVAILTGKHEGRLDGIRGGKSGRRSSPLLFPSDTHFLRSSHCKPQEPLGNEEDEDEPGEERESEETNNVKHEQVEHPEDH